MTSTKKLRLLEILSAFQGMLFFLWGTVFFFGPRIIYLKVPRREGWAYETDLQFYHSLSYGLLAAVLIFLVGLAVIKSRIRSSLANTSLSFAL